MFEIFKTDIKPKNNLFKCFYEDKKVNLSSIRSIDNSSRESYDVSISSKEETYFLGTKMLRERKQKMFRIDNGLSNGKWTEEEHKKFIEALYIYNFKWYDIQSYVTTRSSGQIRSHAQKFYLRLKDFKEDSLGLDFTLDSVKNLKDIINIVKKKELESLSDTKDKLLFILSEKINFGKKLRKKNKKPKRVNHISKHDEDLNKKNDLIEDDNGNDYLWNDKNELELSLDTISFGLDYKVNDFTYFRKLSL